MGGKLLEWYVEKHKNDPLIDTLVFSFSQSHVDAQGLTPKGQQAGLSQDINAQLAAYSLKIQEGDGRFLIALLGLLNYDLIVQETHQTPKHIEYTAGAVGVPKNEHKIVTINLPKPRGKRIYDQMFSVRERQRRSIGGVDIGALTVTLTAMYCAVCGSKR